MNNGVCIVDLNALLNSEKTFENQENIVNSKNIYYKKYYIKTTSSLLEFKKNAETKD